MQQRSSAPEVPQGTYFITGASGFIGGHLIARLLAANCHVVAADQRALTAAPQQGVTQVACDITDQASVEHAVAQKPIDYAIHLAAKVGDWGERADFERVNVEGTRNVLSALHKASVKRMIHISSIAAMGFSPGRHADETMAPLTEGDVYSSTKGKGEVVARELQEKGAPVVIIRPGDVYGPGSEPWVNRPVRMMRSHQMLFIDRGTGHFGHVYVDNLIDAMLLALGNPRATGQTYIITDDEQLTTFKDYFTRLAEASGSPVPKIAIPKAGALLLAKGYELVARRFGVTPQITETAVEFVTKHCSYSIVKARNELGYAPRVNLEEGMARVRAAFLGAAGD